MRQFMEGFDDVDWTDVSFLLRRFSGPTVVANATGEDAEALSQSEASPADTQRPAIARKGVTYL